jgi:hypothetical protein
VDRHAPAPGIQADGQWLTIYLTTWLIVVALTLRST